jgi:hypothetical protein
VCSSDLAFTAVGKVIAYDIFTGRAGTQAIQIWRPIDVAAGTYTLLCENVITAGTADVDFHFQLPVSDHCLVGPGDVLGKSTSNPPLLVISRYFLTDCL